MSPDTTEAPFEGSGLNCAVRACQRVLHFLGQLPARNRLERLIKDTDWQDESANDQSFPHAASGRGQDGYWPAWQIEQLVFVGHGTLLLKIPHQHVYEMRVLDGDGDLLKHVLESNGRLLQPAKAERIQTQIWFMLSKWRWMINKRRVSSLSWFTQPHVIPDVYLSFLNMNEDLVFKKSITFIYKHPKKLKLQKNTFINHKSNSNDSWG